MPHPRGTASSRRVGVLLHPTALPESPVCGSFGAAARGWLHALARQGIKVWQVLPLAPPDGTGSPYSSPSSFAINPWLLDAQDLSDEGFIAPDDVLALPQGTEANGERAEGLDFALADQRRRSDLARWLRDHSAFMVLRRESAGLPWWDWAHELAE